MIRDAAPTSFTTVRTEGGLLPPDLLARVVAGDRDLGGFAPADYHLASGESPREAANRAWAYLLGVWEAFRQVREKLPPGDAAVGVTREKWLLLLFRELGYGRVSPTPAGGLVAGDRAFPVSHRWERLPLHLLGWGVEELDKKTKGVPGAAERAPHAMLQELLNRSPDHLWGVVSNGRVLRLLRDTSSLAGPSYVEFDLETMFDAEVFSDFALLFLLLHQSRVEVPPDAPPSDCWLERWRTAAAESGVRARGLLREGVQAAIETLGSGFLRANPDFNRRLADREVGLDDYHRALLRLVYRLLFLFVAEDRGQLLRGGTDAVTAERYHRYFSTARLRRLSLRRRGTGHTDLWDGLSLVFDALGREEGRPELGLPGIGGIFDPSPLDVVTGLRLPNDALLAAVRHLHVVQPKGQPKRTVDYRNLGADELGSIYESLLELVPRHDQVERAFTLEGLAGNERKTSGSYYTPSALIDLVLDEALDPLLDAAERAPDAEAALLGLTVCDPACGSGHFLVAAARRIATRVAYVRTGDRDPAPGDLQEALYDVIARCVYGVDLNPMAAELAKVSLWLEGMRQDRPLTFLDAHVKVGNALLGTTPALLAAGVPDAAFDPIEGDDRKHATTLRRVNSKQRKWGQGEFFETAADLTVSNHAVRKALREAVPAPAVTLEDVHVAQRRYAAYQQSAELIRERRVADAWCAAFVQRKVPGAPAVTRETVVALDHDDPVSPETVALVDDLARQYRFFHWHLEFPEIFDVPEGGAATPTGWVGGFSAVIGNPPWERVKLQEQEFFASRDEEIAKAPNAAARKKLIKTLPDRLPSLAEEWSAARRRSEGESHLLRDSGRFPLCGRGDVNTYAVFAEHFRTVIAPTGRMGVITPTGLATDATTAPFFEDTVRSGRLAAFYDFENEAKIFPGVHNQYRFAVSAMTGGERITEISFAFYTRHVADVAARRYALAPDEVSLLNPNTGTLPLFRSRPDAEITLGIYGRHPVLVHDHTAANPWGLRFVRLFDMATDSALFRTETDLLKARATFDGWSWGNGPHAWLPLYEAKLLGHYDHRFATYDGATQAQINKGTLPHVTDAAHDDPAVEPLARYWVRAEDVTEAIADRWDRDWLFGWRDIARASDARTFVPCVLPRAAVGHVFPLVLPSVPTVAPLLQAAWSSYVGDYVVRQKLSGTHLTYGVLAQLACPSPATFEAAQPWSGGEALKEWVLPRVVELQYTSWRIAPYARDLGDGGPPFRWVPERRELLRAELDAAMFHVYGLTRPEVEHVLDSFFVVRRYEERDYGEFRTKRLVLEIYDEMAKAAEAGEAYRTVLDPPPGAGPRHPDIEERP